MRNLDILKQYVERFCKIASTKDNEVKNEVIGRLVTGVGQKANQSLCVLDVFVDGDVLFRKEEYFYENVISREEVEDRLSTQIIDSIIFAGINTLLKLAKELDQPGRPPEKNNDVNFLKEPLSHANLILLGYKSYGDNVYKHSGSYLYRIQYRPQYTPPHYAAMSNGDVGSGYITSIDNLEQLNYFHKAITGKFLF